MKNFILFSLVLFFSIEGISQNICGTPGGAPPGCLMCSPVITGTNAGFGPGQAFACGVPHNSVYMHFIADNSGSMSAVLVTTNCQTGDGLEMVLFDGLTGAEAGCFSSQGAISGTLNIGGLTPGRIYVIMIDGFNGDVCDFSFVVSSGISITPPPYPGPITVSPLFERMCANVPITYSVVPNPEISNYQWEIPANGTIVSGAGTNQITVEYNTTGAGIVKVAGASTCNPGIPSIVPVNVLPTIPIVEPLRTFCQEEFPVQVDNHLFQRPGNFIFNLLTSNGCDSTITYTILSHIQIPKVIDSTICTGQSVIFGNQTFNQSGSYDVILNNAAATGCDSLIKLVLTVRNNLSSPVQDSLLDCKSGATLDLTLGNIPTDPNFLWSSFNGGNILNNVTDSIIKINAPGIYVAEVFSNGCLRKDTFNVTKRTAPTVPILDTLMDNQCNLDPLIVKLDSMDDTDSLIWNFVGLDTFKTVFIDSLMYQPASLYDTLRISAENECGIGVKLDTVIKIKPYSLPKLNLATSGACINEPYRVETNPVDSNITLQWLLNGGSLVIPPVANTFEVYWSTPGVKDLGLMTTQDSCLSPPDMAQVTVYEPYSDLDILCQSTTGTVDFIWTDIPHANTYNVTVLSGQTGTQSGNQFTVSGLSPNEAVDILVTVDGINACGSRTFSQTCTAQNCAPVSVDINPLSDICLTQNISPQQLTANISGAVGGGVLEWTGPGILNNFFNPNVAGPGTHPVRLIYRENNCDYIAVSSITVIEVPNAIFTTSGSICSGESVSLNYTGNFSGTLNYYWDVGDGRILNNSNSGNVEVEFQTSGLKTVSLLTEANGCTSQRFSQQIQVDQRLGNIQYNCSNTPTSVTIEWPQDPAAVGYQVNNLGGQLGTISGNSYTINNLFPDEEVNIEITAKSGGNCPDVVEVISCKAGPCPVIPPFTVNCTASISDMIFSWPDLPNAVDYQVVSSTGHTGQLNGTEYWIRGLSPDETVEITVIAVSLLNCSQTTSIQSCTTTTCPAANTQITAVPDFCEGEPSYQVLLMNTNGLTNIRWSGDVDATGNFNPNLQGNYSATVDFEIDNCSYTLSQTITVYQIPTSDFLLSNSTICQSEIITAEYTGNASQNANYTWNFDQANVLNSTSSVFYELEYPTPGFQEVTLMVEENGCFSTIETQAIQIDERLIEPFINCDVTTNRIEFTWDDVRNARDFQIDIVSGQTGIQTGNSYVFDNLNINEEVTISITANSENNCPSTQSQKTCVTKDCPPRGLTISPVNTNYCEGDMNSYQLEATIDGAQLNSYIWSGVGVSSPGDFSPANLLAGEYNVSVAYEEAGCFYSQTLNLTIEPNPDLNLTVNSPIWRLNNVGSIEVNPSGGTPPYDLNWNNGSTQNQINNLGVGTYCVTLTDENGCEEVKCEEITEGNYIVKPIHVICPRDFLRLDITPRSGANFEWSPLTGLSCGTCPNPFVSLQKSTFYDVKATLPSGQSESTRVMVVVLPQVICSFKKEAPENWDFVMADLDLNNLTEKDIQKVEKRIINFYQGKEVNIYPNPTEGQLTIDSSNPFNSLEIYDMSGRRVMKTNSSTVDLSNQSKGIYFFKIIFENEAMVKRVVFQ